MWRLEAAGFDLVYDHAAAKVDWLAADTRPLRRMRACALPSLQGARLSEAGLLGARARPTTRVPPTDRRHGAGPGLGPRGRLRIAAPGAARIVTIAKPSRQA